MSTFTAVLIPDAEGGFVAQNPQTGTTSQGETIEEALANLKDATVEKGRSGRPWPALQLWERRWRFGYSLRFQICASSV